MRFLSLCTIVAAIGMLADCNHVDPMQISPTAPEAPVAKGNPQPASKGDPQPVSVRSGRTDQEVSGTTMTARLGEQLHIAVPGFFQLNTTFAPPSSVYLWPADDGYLSSNYTRALVYGGSDPGILNRAALGVQVIGIMPGAGVAAVAEAMESLRNAAAADSAAHPALDFVVGQPGQLAVSIDVNPADDGFVQNPNAAALTYCTATPGGIITNARIVMRSMDIRSFWYTWDNFTVMVEHEVIHATGLAHDAPGEEQGRMSATAAAYAAPGFTDREKLVMRLQYLRRPGTRLTGNVETEGAVSASSGQRHERLVCVITR